MLKGKLVSQMEREVNLSLRIKRGTRHSLYQFAALLVT